jgi:lipopolysaccharide transport system permease protein
MSVEDAKSEAMALTPSGDGSDGAVAAAARPAPPAEQPTRIIRPRHGWSRVDFAALWQYRDLVRFLTWRDIQLRYRQTALGVAWALLQPLATMAVFTVFFGRFGKMPSDGLPYPLFAFCALVPWQLFAYALNESSNSLVGNQNLVTKIYFPRLIIPLSSVLSGLMDFMVSFVLLLGMLAWYHKIPTAAVIVLPALVLLAIVTALGVGLWLSALNVQYRDVRYTIPFLTQFWFFATPIAYSSALVPPRWRLLVGLNPMAGVVEGFRHALLGTGAVPSLVWVSVLVSLLVFLTGLQYFGRMERKFADVV